MKFQMMPKFRNSFGKSFGKFIVPQVPSNNSTRRRTPPPLHHFGQTLPSYYKYGADNTVLMGGQNKKNGQI